MVRSDSIHSRTIVGLEIHVQLATRTKLFCGCAVEFGAEPNSRVCPVCLGLPGALPVMNRQAFAFATRFALAMNCRIAAYTKWDRKSYFYPDLPKNYQISQYDLPMSSAGSVAIVGDDGTAKPVGIIRAHLEEDAGKNIHDAPGGTLVDLNRTGTPLLEIVTEPDLASGEEAFRFCTELQRLAVYLGVSDGNMQLGQMRFEPNINVEIQRDGKTCYTPISEVKNLNSFRAVRDAIEYEARRQVQDWLANPDYVKGRAANENRGWNADAGVTEFQRGKELAHDYRYFPDPDLVPVTVTEDWIAAQQAELPELPQARMERLVHGQGLKPKDAEAIIADRGDADLFDAACQDDTRLTRRVGNLMLGAARRIANEQSTPVSALLPDAACWRQLAELVEDGAINASAGERLLEEVLVEGIREVDFQALAEERNLIQVQDAAQIERWLAEALRANAAAVKDARENPKKAQRALGFLTGQVMKLSGGQADPKQVNALLRQKLTGDDQATDG